MLRARRRRLLVVIAALALTAAGCGSDNKVGDDALLKLDDPNASGDRLGASTTTAVASVNTTAPPATTALRVAPTTAVPTYEIGIFGDKSGNKPFDPTPARVFRGMTVTWVNRDVEPRSVEADNGAFMSPMLPPGGRFQYRADVVGIFNYHDGTRPYAGSTLEVLAR